MTLHWPSARSSAGKDTCTQNRPVTVTLPITITVTVGVTAIVTDTATSVTVTYLVHVRVLDVDGWKKHYDVKNIRMPHFYRSTPRTLRSRFATLIPRRPHPTRTCTTNFILDIYRYSSRSAVPVARLYLLGYSVDTVLVVGCGSYSRFSCDIGVVRLWLVIPLLSCVLSITPTKTFVNSGLFVFFGFTLPPNQ